MAAVAADSPEAAEAALAAIELEIEPADPVADPEAAIAPGAPLVHPEWDRYACVLEGERDGNVAWMPALACGDVDREFARDDVVVVEDAFEARRASTRATSSRAARSRASRPGAASSTPRRSSPISCATASPRRWSSARRRCG